MSRGMEHPELAAIEAALSSLAPAPAAIDRDRLLFQAGRASALRRRWLWCGLGAASTAGAAVVAWALLMLNHPEPSVRVVYVPMTMSLPGPSKEPSSTDSMASAASLAAEAARWEPSGTGYLSLERQVLRAGIDALPSSPPLAEGAPPLTQHELRGSALARPERSPRWLENSF